MVIHTIILHTIIGTIIGGGLLHTTIARIIIGGGIHIITLIAIIHITIITGAHIIHIQEVAVLILMVQDQAD